jgi:hypothetical protein
LYAVGNTAKILAYVVELAHKGIQPPQWSPQALQLAAKHCCCQPSRCSSLKRLKMMFELQNFVRSALTYRPLSANLSQEAQHSPVLLHDTAAQQPQQQTCEQVPGTVIGMRSQNGPIH